MHTDAIAGLQTPGRTRHMRFGHGLPRWIKASELTQSINGPSPEIAPAKIPALLMQALMNNNFPEIDSGLRLMWAFAGDTTNFMFQNNMTEFIESAHETADQYPTSFYGMAMFGRTWELEGNINMVGGDESSCWIATQVMKTVSCDGRMRRWQWELRKHRRPPLMGAWYVESIGSSDRLGNFDVEG